MTSRLHLGMAAVRAATATLACLASPLSSVAHADEPPCNAVRITVVGTLSAPWDRAVADLDATVRLLPPEECGQVDLVVEAVPGGVSLTAQLADGRSGTRAARRPDTLVVVAIGLIATLPHHDAATSSSVASAPATRAPAPPVAPPTIATDDLPPSTPALPRAQASLAIAAKRTLHVDAEFGAGVRLAMPTSIAMPDFVARADLIESDWVGSVSFRVAPTATSVRMPLTAYDYVEVGVGLGGGRRLHVGELTIDLTLVVSVTVVAQEGNPPNDGLGGTASELRLAPTARFIIPTKWALRPALVVDGEVAPLGLVTPTQIDPALAPLPSWTLGVRVAAVGELL